MGHVAVVTDSTCDLPAPLVEATGIRVVPLSVSFGTDTFMSGVTITTEAFYDRLAAATDRLPTTSQPAPAWFEEAYADCADDGASAIVSVHVSSALSGTVALARDRATRSAVPVEVVDSQLVGGALGLAVLAAQRVAAAGGSVPEVVDAVRWVREHTTSRLVVDTLTYLRRGGRLTGTQAAVGGALRVKPILHLVDGRVEVRERVRTWARALERVAVAAADVADGAPVDAIVAHALAPERAEAVWRTLAASVTVVERIDARIGPIVGTHVGPGAVAVAVVPHG